MNCNKKEGNAFERKFCEILSYYGFWVLNVPQNAAGQPADVIAARSGNSFLIDCKVYSRRGFVLSRVEENQRNAMELWQACGNGVGWFAIETMNGEVWMISLDALDEIGKTKTIASRDDLKRHGCRLIDWVQKYGNVHFKSYSDCKSEQ